MEGWMKTDVRTRDTKSMRPEKDQGPFPTWCNRGQSHDRMYDDGDGLFEKTTLVGKGDEVVGTDEHDRLRRGKESRDTSRRRHLYDRSRHIRYDLNECYTRDVISPTTIDNVVYLKV